MKSQKTKEIIERLLNEIEEEDVGICLFTTSYQNKEELSFFKDQDRKRILEIFKKVSEDSQRHKLMIKKIIAELGEKYIEK